MRDSISNEVAVPAQRPNGNYEQPLVAQELAEELEDDFVKICECLSAGEYLEAVTIAAWDEHNVAETENTDATLRERVAGSVALAIEFYRISEMPDKKGHLRITAA